MTTYLNFPDFVEPFQAQAIRKKTLFFFFRMMVFGTINVWGLNRKHDSLFPYLIIFYYFSFLFFISFLFSLLLQFFPSSFSVFVLFHLFLRLVFVFLHIEIFCLFLTLFIFLLRGPGNYVLSV